MSRIAGQLVVAVAISSVMAVALTFWAWKRRSAEPQQVPSHDVPHEVSSYGGVTERVRAGLEGSKSRCDQGPPSDAERAEWNRLREPRPLESVSNEKLAKRDDATLVEEMESRVLDRVY